jgi:hypothetical protein
MIRIESIELLRDLLAESGSLERPSIEPVVPVIRSGDQMLFQAPGQVWLDREEQKRLKGRLDIGSSADDGDGDDDDDTAPRPKRATRRVLIGEIVVEFGYDATDDRDLQDFVAFYEDHILAFLQAAGIRYRGTYGVLNSSDRGGGKYRTIWSFRGQNAVDRMTRAADPAPNLGVSELGAVTRRLRALASNEAGAGRSQNWYQPAWGFRR